MDAARVKFTVRHTSGGVAWYFWCWSTARTPIAKGTDARRQRGFVVRIARATVVAWPPQMDFVRLGSNTGQQRECPRMIAKVIVTRHSASSTKGAKTRTHTCTSIILPIVHVSQSGIRDAFQHLSHAVGYRSRALHSMNYSNWFVMDRGESSRRSQNGRSRTRPRHFLEQWGQPPGTACDDKMDETHIPHRFWLSQIMIDQKLHVALPRCKLLFHPDL